MRLLNPVCPFHYEFLEAQVSAGLRKGRSEDPLPIWHRNRDCVGRGRLICCLPGGYLGAAVVQMILLVRWIG